MQQLPYYPFMTRSGPVRRKLTYDAIVFTEDGHYFAEDADDHIFCQDSPTACLQEAVNYVNNGGGGIVHIRRGNYNISQSITMLSGVIVEGEGYLMSLVEPSPPEQESPVSGTIINANGIDAFIGSDITSGGIRDLLINYPARGIAFGAANTLGCAFFNIKNVMIYQPSVRGIDVTNFQFLRIDQLYILNVPGGSSAVAPGAWFKNNHNSWSGGNSVFTDIFIRGGAQADGVITFEADDNSLNLIDVIRPQVNMWGSNGVGANVKYFNNTNYTSSISRINIYGGDFEGGAESAVELIGAIENYINIAFSDATYSVYLTANSYTQQSESNTITGRITSIYNATLWQNFVISPYPGFSIASGGTNGIFGLVIKNNPASGNSRPALLVGNQTIYTDDHISIREPGRNFGTATIASGSTSVTVNHGLSCTPTLVNVTPLAQPSGSLWVSSITGTSFTINISAAPSANLSVAWLAEC
jgi:hypothetical protein